MLSISVDRHKGVGFGIFGGKRASLTPGLCLPGWLRRGKGNRLTFWVWVITRRRPGNNAWWWSRGGGDGEGGGYSVADCTVQLLLMMNPNMHQKQIPQGFSESDEEYNEEWRGNIFHHIVNPTDYVIIVYLKPQLPQLQGVLRAAPPPPPGGSLHPLSPKSCMS